MFVLTRESYAEQQYQTEVTTTYRKLDSWNNMPFSPFLFATRTDNGTIAYGLTGELFFAPANTLSHPIAEAAFLEHTGSVFLSLERVEQRLGTFEGTGPGLHLAVNYARSGSPLTVEASFEESKSHFTAGNIVDWKTDRYGIKVGDYFTNGLLAGVGIDHTKTNDLSGPSFILNADVLSYQLFLKYVRQLEGGKGIKVETKIEWSAWSTDDGRKDTSSDIMSVSIVYYWTQAIGTGIGFQQSGGIYTPQGQTYTASVDYFITPSFSVKGVYDRFLTSNNVYGDSNSYNIALAARF
jgi:hypothetical protein